MAVTQTETVDGTRLHRRKTSRDEDQNVLIFPADEPSPPIMQMPPPPTNGKQFPPIVNGAQDTPKQYPKFVGIEPEERKILNGRNGWAGHNRVASYSPASSIPHQAIPTSQSHPSHPPSAGPYRTSFAQPTWSPPPNGSYSYVPNGRHQPPAMRQSLSLPADSAHARTRSVSGPFTPITPSPLSTSFAASRTAPQLSPQTARSVSHGLTIATSPTAPDLHPQHSPPKPRFPGANGMPSPPGISPHTRRHSRIHSRNLSVYFPRPGSISATSIDEDGTQEVNFVTSASYDSTSSSEDGVLIPSASPAPGQVSFRAGFTFGGRTNGDASEFVEPGASPLPSLPSGTSRRGHHHKHSLSHNFFSFLDPGGSPEDLQLQTQPTLTPVSPWNPISPWPERAQGAVSPAESTSNGSLHGLTIQREKSPVGKVRAEPGIDAGASLAAGMQFVLGATMWVVGQQAGSLACTGLGYWVVFDAFGVALGQVIPGYLARPQAQAGTRRPYGNARIETLMTYAQSVFLLFASVYMCKETVEHVLLAHDDGHHHTHGEVNAVFGIDCSPLLLCLTLLSLLFTSIKYNNQSKLVSATGNYIPPLPALLPIRMSYNISRYSYPPQIENLLSNPYTLAPTLFCASLLGGLLTLPSYQHRTFDLLLAGVETVVTFTLAYPAAVALGAVLLQTAPPRGLPGGRMEAFLRAMREIERHPQVLHLPAPHIWQLTPYFSRPSNTRSSLTSSSSSSSASSSSPLSSTKDTPTQSLVVTLELHVAQALSDDDALRLTQWAWERCRTALRYGSGDGGGGEGEAEITVGIVRG